MSLAHTLEQAERFIAGFEDDASQEGVQALLQRLRLHQTARYLPLLNPQQAPRYIDGKARATNYTGTHFGRVFHDDRPPLIGRWLCQEGRQDQLDRTWERFFIAVVDDFGNLVEVPA